MVEHLHRVSFSAERTPRYEMLDGMNKLSCMNATEAAELKLTIERYF